MYQCTAKHFSWMRPRPKWANLPHTNEKLTEAEMDELESTLEKQQLNDAVAEDRALHGFGIDSSDDEEQTVPATEDTVHTTEPVPPVEASLYASQVNKATQTAPMSTVSVAAEATVPHGHVGLLQRQLEEARSELSRKESELLATQRNLRRWRSRAEEATANTIPSNNADAPSLDESVDSLIAHLEDVSGMFVNSNRKKAAVGFGLNQYYGALVDKIF